jgi:hypothetical protein
MKAAATDSVGYYEFKQHKPWFDEVIKRGNTRMYPKVSGLAAWCKWYSSLPLGAVVSLLCESV